MPALGPFRRVLRKVKGRYVSGLESQHPASIRARAATLAILDVGYHETPAGSNLQRYGAWWDSNGYAWCGYAVARWWQLAGFDISRDLALKIGYVPTLKAMARAKQHGLFIVGKNRVSRGDAVCFEFNGDENPDHVGLFVEWINRRAGTFFCVEGNTSKTGSQSNGGAVELQIRSLALVSAFVRKGPKT